MVEGTLSSVGVRDVGGGIATGRGEGMDVLRGDHIFFARG
jgi:hypothetical protein